MTGPDMTGTERAVIDAVDDGGMVSMLVDLVAYRSVGGDESPAQDHMATLLEASGMDVDRWEIDLEALSHDPDFSCEVERSEGLGVVGRVGGSHIGSPHTGSQHTGSQPPSLMLNGHIDVVPVGDRDLWSTDPWQATVIDGEVRGRGSVDMKAGLVCAVAAVCAIRDAGVTLDGSVSVASVIGEEDGGVGTLATLLRGHTADAAVVVEPTGGDIAVSQAGALGFRIRVPGLPAHGALRSEGVSAVEKFAIVHDALVALEGERNRRFRDPLFAHLDLPLALSIGTVRAGEWASTVPDRLVAEGRYGVAPGEEVAAARDEFEAAVASAAATDPWLATQHPVVEWWGGRFHPATTAADHPLVAALADSHRSVAGTPARVCGVPYGSDLRHLVNRGGIPSVLYGPGDVRLAHAPDERIPIAELSRVARTLALLIVRFCGVAPGR